jgi:hypothetical protein
MLIELVEGEGLDEALFFLSLIVPGIQRYFI